MIGKKNGHIQPIKISSKGRFRVPKRIRDWGKQLESNGWDIEIKNGDVVHSFPARNEEKQITVPKIIREELKLDIGSKVTIVFIPRKNE